MWSEELWSFMSLKMISGLVETKSLSRLEMLVEDWLVVLLESRGLSLTCEVNYEFGKYRHFLLSINKVSLTLKLVICFEF